MRGLEHLRQHIQGLLVKLLKFLVHWTRCRVQHGTNNTVSNFVRAGTHQDVFCFHAFPPQYSAAVCPDPERDDGGPGMRRA